MRKKLLLVVLIAISLNTFAQYHKHAGYIINNDKDTIKGFIEYRGDIDGSLFCLFSINENEAPIKYLPENLLEYGISGEKTFESIMINDSIGLQGQYFTEVLVKGELSLYSILNKKTKNRDIYLVTKDGKFHLLYETREEKTVLTTKPGDNFASEQKVMVTSKKYITTLRNHMSNCSAIYRSFEELKLNNKGLIEIFKKYNSCINKDFEVKTNENAYKYEVKKGISIGYGKAVFLDDYYLLQGGIFFSFYKPRLDNKLGFNIGLYFSSHEDYYDGFFDQYYYDIYTLDIPLTFEIYFNQRKIQPYLGVGADFRVNYLTTNDKSIDLAFFPLVIETGINQYLKNNNFIKYNISLRGDYLTLGVGYGF